MSCRGKGSVEVRQCGSRGCGAGGQGVRGVRSQSLSSAYMVAHVPQMIVHPLLPFPFPLPQGGSCKASRPHKCASAAQIDPTSCSFLPAGPPLGERPPTPAWASRPAA
eukprot:366413-Chlamydomonas_euryale.AAC.1